MEYPDGKVVDETPLFTTIMKAFKHNPQLRPDLLGKNIKEIIEIAMKEYISY